jgi:hypothetical protein
LEISLSLRRFILAPKTLGPAFGFGGSLASSAKANLTGNEVLSFQNVTVSTIPPATIEVALNAGLETEKLGDERIEHGIVHVVYEYLYSSKVEIILGNGNHASIGLRGNASNAAKAKVEASSEGKKVDSTSYHERDEPLAVAFKAAQLVKIGSNWRLRLIRTSGVGIDPQQATRSPYVFKPNETLNIED